MSLFFSHLSTLVRPKNKYFAVSADGSGSGGADGGGGGGGGVLDMVGDAPKLSSMAGRSGGDESTKSSPTGSSSSASGGGGGAKMGSFMKDAMGFFSPTSLARQKKFEAERREASLDIMGESSQIIGALKAEVSRRCCCCCRWGLGVGGSGDVHGVAMGGGGRGLGVCLLLCPCCEGAATVYTAYDGFYVDNKKQRSVASLQQYSLILVLS